MSIKSNLKKKKDQHTVYPSLELEDILSHFSEASIYELTSYVRHDSLQF